MWKSLNSGSIYGNRFHDFDAILILKLMKFAFYIAIFRKIRVRERREDQNPDFDLKMMEFVQNGVEIVDFGIDLLKSYQIERFRRHFDFEMIEFTSSIAFLRKFGFWKIKTRISISR